MPRKPLTALSRQSTQHHPDGRATNAAVALPDSTVYPRQVANDSASQLPEGYLDIYKLAVEMADRVSARRAVASSYFLTAQGALVVLIGATSENGNLQWPRCGLLRWPHRPSCLLCR